MNKLILLFLSIFLSLGSIAQTTNRYMVFFTDKNNNPYSINQPQNYLSAKAISREGRAINDEDLPVTPDYLSTLITNDATIIGTSKWMNGALITLLDTDVSIINSLSFVQQVEYIAPGAQPPVVGGRYSSEDQESEDEELSATLAQQNMLNSDIMRQDGYLGKGLLVAVLDGGFRGVDQGAYFSHLYANQQIMDIHNFVTSGEDVYNYSDHGTRVFSTISALGTDYDGIATESNFLLYVTEDVNSEYRIEEYNWLMAAERADSAGVDIITTSLGYSDFDDASMDYTHDDLDGKTAVITIAAEKAYEKGIIVVASAGNSGNKAWEKVTPPADGEHVICVGSVDEFEMKSNFSSIGPINANWIKPDLMAMGERAVVIGQSGITTSSGTSFATPQVAGLIAGLKGKYPNITNAALIDIIKNSADRAGNPDNSYGYGIPSYQAFENFYETGTQSAFLNVYPNPILDDGLMQVKVSDPNAINELGLVIYTTDGKKIFETSKSISWQNNPVLVDLNVLSKGVYIARIITTEQIVTKRIIKQ